MPTGYGRLRGAVGLQRFGSDCSNGVTFRVVQDGVTRWQSGSLRSLREAEDLGTVAVHPGAVELVADPQGRLGGRDGIGLSSERLGSLYPWPAGG